MKTDMSLWSYLTKSFLEWETFQLQVVEKTKSHTHITAKIIFQIRAVYEAMWKNVAESDRTHENTIRPMRFACWITKAITYLLHGAESFLRS